MRHTLVCLLVGLALLIGGCSGSDGDPPSKGPAPDPNLSDQIAEAGKVPKEPLEAREERASRDPAAVAAGLWRLDPCRLIAPKGGNPGTVERGAPHRCTLSIGQTEVYLVLGVPLHVGERKQLGATNIMGAKAYVQPGGPRRGGCRAWLPVGGTQSIRIDDEFAECWRVREVMRRVIKRVDATSSRQAVPGMPVVQTCPLLRHGLGPAVKGRTVGYGAVEGYGIDHCVAVPDDLSLGGTSSFERYAELELESHQTQTLTVEEGLSDTPTPDEYASSGWPADFGTIRGRAVFGSRGSGADNCTMRWAESTTILHLDAKSCALGRRLVKRMTKLLDNTSRRSVAPQSPLLYGAADDDLQQQGACVDYLPLWFGREHTSDTDLEEGPACHPYIEPDLPDDPAEVVVTAQVDPDVTCSLALDAVRTEFGERLEPATLEAYTPPIAGPDEMIPPPLRARPCVFVDPKRKLQVQVLVSSDPMPLSRYAAEQLKETDSPTRGFLGPGTYGIGTGYLIGLGKHADDPGYVAVFAGRRQQTSGSLGDYGPLNDARTRTEKVADAIVDEHLAEAS